MPIQTFLFFFYVALATLVAFQNWRVGPFLIVFAAAIQDPIRKTTPDVPAWMVLGTAIIFASWAVGFVSRYPNWWGEFREREFLLARAVEIFAIGLVIPIIIDLQYGVGGVKLIILGMLFYGVGLANLVLGFYYGNDAGTVRRLFRFYCIVTGIMVTGVLLEYRGVFPNWSALGTEVFGNTWIRYIPGRQVRMFAGFYRSPDIMGWHTTMASLLALVLATTTRSIPAGLFWLGLSGWGLIGTFFCGRRKFFYMVPVFLLALMWLHLRKSGAGAGRFATMGILSLGLFYGVYMVVGPYEDVAVYYFATVGDTMQRAQAHGLDAVVSTFRQSGLLGKGLGAAATGAHRLSGSGRPHTWQEGGLSRLAVELGLPGLLCALWLGYVLFQRLHISGRRLAQEGVPDTDLYLGVFALIIANGASFVVSGQIFGAPFVGFFFSLLLGIALAGAGAAALEPMPDRSPAPVAPLAPQGPAPRAPSAGEGVRAEGRLTTNQANGHE